MHTRESLGVSERRSCRVIGQHRSTQRKWPQEKVDEELLTRDIIKLAREYGRYGYRRIAVLLKNTGWQVNAKRVERIWRREGLKVPMKQPKRGRLWFNDGSCVRLRALRPNHVWSYDFVHDRTYDGKAFRTLNILDEYTRECLAIRVDRKLNSQNVLDVLTDLFIIRGFPEYISLENSLDRFRFSYFPNIRHLEKNIRSLETSFLPSEDSNKITNLFNTIVEYV